MKRKYRVHVQAYAGTAHVRLVRWRWAMDSHITVGKVRLDRNDADARLAEIRMKARDMARQLNDLER